jgi:hypothetical protein
MMACSAARCSSSATAAGPSSRSNVVPCEPHTPATRSADDVQPSCPVGTIFHSKLQFLLNANVHSQRFPISTTSSYVWRSKAHLACQDVAQLLLHCKVAARGKGALLQAAISRPQRHPQRIWKRLELQVYFKRLRMEGKPHWSDVQSSTASMVLHCSTGNSTPTLTDSRTIPQSQQQRTC